jgi:two-component system LytT family response regulator
MRTVIIEDEHIAAQALQSLIKEIEPTIEIVAVLQSIEESVEWFSLNPTPNLVFMDIHLADGSSFAIFDKIKISCPIIFTTAYDEYALKAFEVNSIDYLLKPIRKEDLERAFTKFNNLSATNTPFNPNILTELIQSLKNGGNQYKTNFLIPYRDTLKPLAVSNIAYIYTENKMVTIFTLNGEAFHIDTSLDELHKQLDPTLFFRANRQYVIAHKAIKEISHWFGKKLSVNLTISVPEKIVVSKARVPEFKEWYTK